MNDTVKKVALVAVAVLALGIVAFEGYKLMAPPALEKGVTHPSPAKSLAQMEKEEMQREDADAAAGKGQGAPTGGDTAADPSGSPSGQR